MLKERIDDLDAKYEDVESIRLKTSNEIHEAIETIRKIEE